MQNKINIMPTAVTGLIIVAFSVAAFFLLDIERTPMHWWALAFLLLSELVLFSGLIAVRLLGANHSRVFMRSGVMAALFLYFFATLGCVAFTSSFDGLNVFILTELAIIVVFTVIIIPIFAISRRITVNDTTIVNARGFMDTCENRVGSLLADILNKNYAGALNSVCESIKYSDKIGSSSVDTKIDEAITKLEASLGDDQKREEDIMGIFDEISLLLNRRKSEISQSRRGGF